MIKPICEAASLVNAQFDAILDAAKSAQRGDSGVTYTFADGSMVEVRNMGDRLAWAPNGMSI